MAVQVQKKNLTNAVAIALASILIIGIVTPTNGCFSSNGKTDSTNTNSTNNTGIKSIDLSDLPLADGKIFSKVFGYIFINAEIEAGFVD
jgi:hypothetical protein